VSVADAFEHAHDSALTQTLADTWTNRHFKNLVVQNNMEITVVLCNCSPSQFSPWFRQPVIESKNPKRGGDLARSVKISEHHRRLWVQKISSTYGSQCCKILTAGQSKEGHPKFPLKTICCSLVGRSDPLILISTMLCMRLGAISTVISYKYHCQDSGLQDAGKCLFLDG
jgi:hypothetical protein